MDESPPLEELQARKRLVQARMELHRAEMALYVRQATSPVRNISSFFSNPKMRWGIMALAGALMVGGGRSRWVQGVTRKISPVLMGPFKNFVATRAMGIAFQVWRNFVKSRRRRDHPPA